MRVDRASNYDAYVDSDFDDDTPAPPVEPDHKELAAFHKNAFDEKAIAYNRLKKMVEELTKQSLEKEAENKALKRDVLILEGGRVGVSSKWDKYNKHETPMTDHDMIVALNGRADRLKQQEEIARAHAEILQEKVDASEEVIKNLKKVNSQLTAQVSTPNQNQYVHQRSSLE
jgi:predicted  nucleic acid-binding Zn-ribbon protein